MCGQPPCSAGGLVGPTPLHCRGVGLTWPTPLQCRGVGRHALPSWVTTANLRTTARPLMTRVVLHDGDGGDGGDAASTDDHTTQRR